MMNKLPNISRFEIQCLRRLWNRKEATVRTIHDDLPNSPSYSTVRKIFERLEEKGAIERVRLDGKAWVYKSAVSSSRMIRKEIQRFLDVFFDGSASPLVSHLADMEALSIEDLHELEKQLDGESNASSGKNSYVEKGGKSS